MSSVSTFGAFTMAKLGIYASQKAMQVTGNNITNVNTKGYTRQELELQSLHVAGADRYSSRWDMRVGAGVISTGVSQIRSPYLDIRYRTEQSNVGMMDAKMTGLNGLGKIFDEVGDGVGDEGVMEAALQKMIEQLEYYSNEGAGLGTFDKIFSETSGEVTSLFNKYASKLEELYDNQVKSLKQDVEKVNSLLSGIQKLNNSIRKEQIHGGNALELQDERNMMIDELASFIRIDVTYESEDAGAGYMVDKLVIRLDGNDPYSGNDGALLIDGKYATQLHVPDLENKELDEMPGSDFKVMLEELRDLNGETRRLKGYYKGQTMTALTQKGTFKIGGFTAEIDPATFPTLDDQLKEFVKQFNANETAKKTADANYAEWVAKVSEDGKTVEFQPKDGTDKDTAAGLKMLPGTRFVEDMDNGVWMEYPEVDLSDNDIYGALQAEREMLTEKGEFASAEDLKIDPSASTKYGIPYYQKIWDAMALKFATVMNDANTLVNPDGTMKSLVDEQGKVVLDANNQPVPIVKPENYYQTDDAGDYVDANGVKLRRIDNPAWDAQNNPDVPKIIFVNKAIYDADNTKLEEGAPVVREQFRGGVLFSNSGDTDDTTGITAKNISIAHSWATGATGVMQSRTDSPNNQSTMNSNLRHMVSVLKDNLYSYRPGESDPEWRADMGVGLTDTDKLGETYFKGSFADMLTKIASTLGNDTRVTQSRLSDYATAQNELAIDRDSVSGVDLNDEAIAMMQYNKSYSAACRLMTTLDEMIDKLINGTAV